LDRSGSVGDIADQMEERRARYGFSYYVVSDRQLDRAAALVAWLARAMSRADSDRRSFRRDRTGVTAPFRMSYAERLDEQPPVQLGPTEGGLAVLTPRRAQRAYLPPLSPGAMPSPWGHGDRS
jgi:hypothetical protein